MRKAACIGGMLTMIKNEANLIATTFEWADEIDLARAERAKAVAEARIEAAKDTMANHDILSSVLHTDINKIRHTLDTVDKKAFEAAVQAILGAKRIYIVAMRSSFALGSFMGFYFNLLFDNVKVLSSSSTSEMFEQLLRIGEGDVFIGISFPRYSKRIINAIDYAKAQGAVTVALTDSESSPLASGAVSMWAKTPMFSSPAQFSLAGRKA